MKKMLSLITAMGIILTAAPTAAMAEDVDPFSWETKTFALNVNVNDGSMWNYSTNNESYYTTIQDLDVRFVEYTADPDEDENAEIIATLDTWNTTDSNPHLIKNFEYNKSHYYQMEIDDLPDGYSWNGCGYVKKAVNLSGYSIYTVKDETSPLSLDIGIEAIPPIDDVMTFPIEGSKEFIFSVVSRDTTTADGDKTSWYDIPLEGLDVSLVSYDYIDPGLETAHVENIQTLAEWNTSDYPTYSYSINYKFDDIDSHVYFGLRINNMPEGYRYGWWQEEDAQVSFCSYQATDIYRALTAKNANYDRPFPCKAIIEPIDTTEDPNIEPGRLSESYENEDEIIIGDVNADNTLDVADCTYITQYLASPDSFPLTDAQKEAADVTGSGDGVTAEDALAIQKYLVGTIDTLG